MIFFKDALEPDHFLWFMTKVGARNCSSSDSRGVVFKWDLSWPPQPPTSLLDSHWLDSQSLNRAKSLLLLHLFDGVEVNLVQIFTRSLNLTCFIPPWRRYVINASFPKVTLTSRYSLPLLYQLGRSYLHLRGSSRPSPSIPPLDWWRAWVVCSHYHSRERIRFADLGITILPMLRAEPVAKV